MLVYSHYISMILDETHLDDKLDSPFMFPKLIANRCLLCRFRLFYAFLFHVNSYSRSDVDRLVEFKPFDLEGISTYFRQRIFTKNVIVLYFMTFV